MKSLLLIVSAWSTGALAATPAQAPVSLAVPGGDEGVGYDDLQYAASLKRILVPAGRTGRLALIDPATNQLTPLAGFTSSVSYRGGHGQGTTSATALDQPGLVVATDRGAQALRVVDTTTGRVGDPVKLEAAPDYVRAVSSTGEVWVTEPGRKQLEIFHTEGRPLRLTHAATIKVADGPESLVIDEARGRAYSHTWGAETYAFDLRARKVATTWKNGCHASRGIALDPARGLLFAGCAEGRATVVDLAVGKVLSSAASGPDVDSIAYGPSLGHLYVPAGGDATLSIYQVSSDGKLTLLGKMETAPDAHTVAVDPVSGKVFVGTPEHGAVLVLHDPYPAAR